ncbi:helix-hairpin-helix domain-containing protein [Natroniella sulfidigena]|uniref:helix-hairpin-helix domain-containing protein n=1 Tax=Natroniella sulfidigena TaxID=723921 RepID=UPI00200A220B|nr:helix-hairpin-helix domain-containing protein [Natroniella sulfidigena]MCK8815903.1 helix-hairpin-helix domain-containing protein [Natroniella sulfidigena]
MRWTKDDFILAGLAVAVVVVSVMLVARNNQFSAQESIEIDSNIEETEVKTGQELAEPQEKDDKMFIHLGGAVVEPGVYEIEEGTRLYQVIEQAGGPTDDADLDAINLVDQLRDGTRVMIPTQGSTAMGNEENVNTASNKVNINTAAQNELEELEGVGPALAERIIEYRRQNGNFSELTELKQVSGIGSRTFDNLESQITY